MDDSPGYRVYLDHLTSSPCGRETVDAVVGILEAFPGIEGSSNSCGRAAARLLAERREELASMTGASHVHFTSGGGEANAAAVLSVGRKMRGEGRGRVVSSRIEHLSVLTALRRLADEGSEIAWLTTGTDGTVDPEELGDLLDEGTGLVTVQHSSRVSAIVQPVARIAGMLRGRRIHYHCDCCAATGRTGLDLGTDGMASASLSGRLAGGGPGAGALLWADDPGDAMSHFHGSTYEASLPAVTGMMTALGETRLGVDARARMMNDLRDEILEGLRNRGMPFERVGGGVGRLPGACLTRLEKPLPSSFHARLERAGMVLPCPRSADRLAYLRELGQDTSEPEKFLGFCLSTSNSIIDVEYFLRVVTECAA
jgi:cysteine desulfurase